MAMVLLQRAGDARAQAPSPPPTNPNPSRPPPQASSQRLAATTALLSSEDLLQPQTDDFVLFFAPASPASPPSPVPSLPWHINPLNTLPCADPLDDGVGSMFVGSGDAPSADAPASHHVALDSAPTAPITDPDTANMEVATAANDAPIAPATLPSPQPQAAVPLDTLKPAVLDAAVSAVDTTSTSLSNPPATTTAVDPAAAAAAAAAVAPTAPLAGLDGQPLMVPDMSLPALDAPISLSNDIPMAMPADFPMLDAGMPFNDGYAAAAAAAAPAPIEQRLSAFARLRFDDGSYYMHTYQIILGRNVQLAHRDMRRLAKVEQLKAKGEKLKAEALLNGGRKRKRPGARSVVSEAGGIVNAPIDMMPMDYQQRRQSVNSQSLSSGSRAQPAESVHDVDHAPQEMLMQALPEVPYQIDNQVPENPNDCPLVPIHPQSITDRTGLKGPKGISRQHAKIYYDFDQGNFCLSVLGSNGLYHEDRFLSKGTVVELAHGDTITIGMVEMCFFLPDIALTQEQRNRQESGSQSRPMSFTFENGRGESEDIDDSGSEDQSVNPRHVYHYPVGSDLESEEDMIAADESMDDDDDAYSPVPAPKPSLKIKLKKHRPEKPAKGHKRKALREVTPEEPPPKKSKKLKEQKLLQKRKEKEERREREREKERQRQKERAKEKEREEREREKQKEKEKERKEKKEKEERLKEKEREKAKAAKAPAKAPAKTPVKAPAKAPSKEPSQPAPDAIATTQEVTAVSPSKETTESTPPVKSESPVFVRRPQPGVDLADLDPEGLITPDMAAQYGLPSSLIGTYLAKRKGPGRPPKDGVMSKRQKSQLIKQGKEIEKARAAGIDPADLPQPTVKPKIVRRKESNAGDDDNILESTEKGDGTVIVGEKRSNKPAKPTRTPSPEMRIEDYTEEQLQRPTSNYVVLIHEAISSAPSGQMNLQQIYNYIEKNYPWYKFKTTTSGWQSSVRHNLGQHDAFVKGDKEGKGYMWRINSNVSIEKERRKRQVSPPQVSHAQRHGQPYYPPPNGYTPYGQPGFYPGMPPQGMPPGGAPRPPPVDATPRLPPSMARNAAAAPPSAPAPSPYASPWAGGATAGSPPSSLPPQPYPPNPHNPAATPGAPSGQYGVLFPTTAQQSASPYSSAPAYTSPFATSGPSPYAAQPRPSPYSPYPPQGPPQNANSTQGPSSTQQAPAPVSHPQQHHDSSAHPSGRYPSTTNPDLIRQLEAFRTVYLQTRIEPGEDLKVDNAIRAYVTPELAARLTPAEANLLSSIKTIPTLEHLRGGSQPIKQEEGAPLAPQPAQANGDSKPLAVPTATAAAIAADAAANTVPSNPPAAGPSEPHKHTPSMTLTPHTAAVQQAHPQSAQAQSVPAPAPAPSASVSVPAPIPAHVTFQAQRPSVEPITPVPGSPAVGSPAVGSPAVQNGGRSTLDGSAPAPHDTTDGAQQEPIKTEGDPVPENAST